MSNNNTIIKALVSLGFKKEIKNLVLYFTADSKDPLFLNGNFDDYETPTAYQLSGGDWTYMRLDKENKVYFAVDLAHENMFEEIQMFSSHLKRYALHNI